MTNELHWGGINGKSLCKAILSDIWMVIAVMIITYLGLGIAAGMKDTPLYTSNSVVAVYPFNKMYTLENSSDALETVSAVNEVFNSDMFLTGLKDRLSEPEGFSLYSQQINGTFMLMLTASSASPENAYQTLRTALDYYEEISPHLVGDSHLEILTEPDFPTAVSNSSKILQYRPLLTLFMGFAMAGFLALMYAVRKTYKTSSAIGRYYKNIRFFKVKASAPDKGSRTNKKKSGKVPNREAMKKTALELLQMLRAKNGSSIFVTSASNNEGKEDITLSLAREMAAFGKSVIVIETDSENSELAEYIGISDEQPRYTISDFLQDKADFNSVLANLPEDNVKVIFADKIDVQDDFSDMANDVGKILEQAEKLADVILVDGCIWTGSRDELIWKKEADTTLAICRQDKADFFAIDRMMTDLRENNPDFLGCVLYGF